jgi:SRSO17 transposase
LDEQQKNYVVAVPETHTVWVAGRQQPVGLLAALLPAEAWVVLSAGEGSKGPRLYEWAWLQLPEESDGPHERARFLLIRRSLADASKRAYYRVAAPTQTTLPEVVHAAGSRWRVEEGYEQAKGEVGLDQYEVRTWRAWYRYITLARLSYAALVVMQGQARALEKKGEEPTSASS